ncbi:MAG: NRDE family protein [Actinomycetes bacterium]
MCTVIVAWKCVPGAPLVVAANRDEMFRRPSEAPLLLADEPQRWGGRDQLAGGTWLAVDPAGRVGAVTNRHPGGVYSPPDRTRSSRGALPLDVLASTDSSAYDLMTSIAPATYNPVNLLYFSPSVAVWTRLDDEAGNHTAALAPGIHVITEQDLDDHSDPKTVHVRGLARAAFEDAPEFPTFVSALRRVLSSHDDLPTCVHGTEHGTVSGATVVVTAEGRVLYEHAEGPPCVTPYARVPLPIDPNWGQ